MKILETNTRTLVVSQNADGSLLITEKGLPIKNAGNFILNLGGIDAVLAKCKDMTEEELLAEKKSKLKKQKAKHEELQRRILAENALIEAAYKKVFTDSATVESTPHNINVLLSFLNTQNWGMWKLPKMTIGYKCNQYDCDGKQATTIILDKPIFYKGEMLSHFQVGAPRGHLTQYARLSFN